MSLPLLRQGARPGHSQPASCSSDARLSALFEARQAVHDIAAPNPIPEFTY